MIYSRATRRRYCRDLAACDRRVKRARRAAREAAQQRLDDVGRESAPVSAASESWRE